MPYRKLTRAEIIRQVLAETCEPYQSRAVLEEARRRAAKAGVPARKLRVQQVYQEITKLRKGRQDADAAAGQLEAEAAELRADRNGAPPAPEPASAKQPPAATYEQIAAARTYLTAMNNDVDVAVMLLKLMTGNVT